MGSDRIDELSKEQLICLLDAVRAMTRVSADPDFGRVLDAALRILLEATDSDRVALFALELEGECEILAFVGGHPPGDPLAEALRRFPAAGSATIAAIRTMTPAAKSVDELGPFGARAMAAGIRELAIIPLQLQGKPGASLNLARNHQRPYDADEVRVAQILGELLVVYIENARLYADARLHLEETRMLLDVGRAVSASLDVDRGLAASAEVLTRMIDASNTFILLLEENDTVLHGVASSNPAHRAEFLDVRIPMAVPSIAVEAVRTKGTVSVEDVESSNLVSRELVDRYGEKSLLALPLLVQDQPIGAVVIDDTRRVRSWSRSEIERAELIAQSVAVGVANARLYEEVRRRSTQLERAQQELVNRERLAALGQLAATMAHEVRNPLGVLFNAIGSLGKMLPAEGDAVMLLVIMREESQRLERLVRELLDFARPLSPSLEAESLQSILEGAIGAAAHESGPSAPTISTEIPSDLPPLRVDASMIRRAIVNLVVNGCQAASRSGKVHVKASLERRCGRRVARIDVTDTGDGMSAELTSRVFEPFFTTKATGTGLGLAVVKGIIDSHGGKIELQSTVGAGTTVTVLLPVDRDSSEPLAPPVRGGW